MAGGKGRHSGKSVLVTGGASGIGLGIVERMLRDGASVASFDLKPTSIGAQAPSGSAASPATPPMRRMSNGRSAKHWRPSAGST